MKLCLLNFTIVIVYELLVHGHSHHIGLESWTLTLHRTHSIGGLKSRVLKFSFLALNDGEKWPRFFLF